MFNILIFIFGLAIGSFLNCVIYRLDVRRPSGRRTSSPEGRRTSNQLSFLRGRSYCPHCQHILSWQDLIPVFSFLILGGKCRYCGKRISWQYPLVELATGILFLLISNFQFPISNEFLISNFQILFWFIISSFLIVIFVYDLKHYVIPDKVIYPAILLTLAFRIWDLFGNWKLEIGNFNTFLNALLSGFTAGVFFLAIVLVSRGRWMGVGDIKLAFLIGLLLGWSNTLLALFLAFLIGAIIGLGLIILKKKTIKSELPFGPFLILGIYIALFFGDKIINWYLGILAY